MVAKLRAYRLGAGYNRQGELAFIQGLDGAVVTGANDVVYYSGVYTYQQISNLDTQYGVLRREFVGTVPGTGGQGVTKAQAIQINTDGSITTTNWTNGVPVGNSVRMYRYTVISNLLTNIEGTLDISDSIIEGSLEITKQIESLDKFDLRISRATFSLDATDEINTFMDSYWRVPNGDTNYVIGVQLEDYFWGLTEYDNILYDEIEKTYIIDTYDPIKWLKNNVWGLRIPSLGIGYSNLNQFLIEVCGLFLNIEGKGINIEVDGNQNWNRDYTGISYATDPNSYPLYLVLDQHLNIQDMLVELMKHYGASIYYDENGDLNFVTRNKKIEASHNESDMLEDLTRTYEIKVFGGLLINITGTTEWGSWEGWVFIQEINGSFSYEVVGASLTQIPKNLDYLDLRQQLPDTSFNYRMFASRTEEEVYEEYKELLRNSQLYETTLDGVDYKLYETLTYNGEEYTINYLQIDFNEQSTKVRMYKSL